MQSPASPQTTRKLSSNLLLVFILTLLAALPRFYGLDSLGFYGDEETMAFPAHSLAAGGEIAMPSGMPYYRALPLTLLNAASARLVGLNNELSYRLPAAAFGTLTVPLLFLLARPIFGVRLALLAALFLAFSEWHIITSREARMYAPFLFFYLGAGFCIWHWTQTAKIRHMILAMALTLIATGFHMLGLFAVLFAIIPIAFRDWSRVSPVRLLIFALLCGLASSLYNQQVASSGFDQWIPAHSVTQPSIQPEPESDNTKHWPASRLDTLPAISKWFAASGLLLGLWAGLRCWKHDDSPGGWLRNTGYVLLLASGFAMASAGQLYAAAIIMIIFFIIHPGRIGTLTGKIMWPLAVAGLLAAVSAGITIRNEGIMDGLKSLLMFPFPYPAFFVQMFAGVMALFVAGAVFLVVYPPSRQDIPLKASLLMVLLPVMAVGAVQDWGGIRYLLETYPFLLLIAAMALVRIVSTLENMTTEFRRIRASVFPAAVVFSVSGILGGHGIPQAFSAATLEYGEAVNRHTLGFPFYPDHRSTGLFVHRNLDDDDIVIAEDALQQRWYAGRVDYWLRDPIGSSIYLYPATDGLLHDIYVNSIAVTPGVLAAIDTETSKRIWIITSGETRHAGSYYLNAQQQAWLERIRKIFRPAYVGKDGVSEVFCINCTDTTGAHVRHNE